MAGVGPQPDGAQVVVGRHVLVVGTDGLEPRAATGTDDDDSRAAVAGALEDEGLLARAERVTGRAEDAASLLELVRGGRLDLAHVDTALDLLARLDRAGRFADVVASARTVTSALALARRWHDLAGALRTAERAAESCGDRGALAWVAHDRGVLRLAAGDARGATADLERAHELRRALGDARALAQTERALQVLCGDLRAMVRDGRLVPAGADPPRRPPRLLVAAALLLLLLGAAVAIAVGGDDGAPLPVAATGTGGGPAQTTPGGGGGGSGSGSGSQPGALARRLAVEPPQGGAVASDPGGIACPDRCAAEFPDTSQVQLTARPAAGFELAGWTGACSGTGGCTVSLDADRTVGARFRRTYLLRVTLDTRQGSGGVASTPAGIACTSGTCEARFAEGTEVVLRASGGFVRWDGACSGSEPCTVRMTADTAVGALFGPA